MFVGGGLYKKYTSFLRGRLLNVDFDNYERRLSPISLTLSSAHLALKYLVTMCGGDTLLCWYRLAHMRA